MQTLYADKLSPSLLAILLRMRLRGPVTLAIVGEAAQGAAQRAACTLLRRVGTPVRFPDARLSRIDERDGVDILSLADPQADAMALAAARALVQVDPGLREADALFRPGALELIAAKHTLWALRQYVVLCLTADHLAGCDPQGEHVAAFHLAPKIATPVALRHIKRLHSIRPPFLGIKSGIGLLLRAARGAMQACLQTRRAKGVDIPGLRRDLPAVAAIADSSISCDRSVRSCPLWHFPSAPEAERYQVIVIHDGNNQIVESAAELSAAGMFLVHEADLGQFPAANPELEAKAGRAKRLILGALLRGCDPWELANLYGHIVGGLLFARMARSCGVRAMITPNCYSTLVDCGDLVADDAGITTFHYQYSFLNYRTLLATRRSDYLILFSNFFRKYFDFGFSRKVMPNGYVFGSSLPLTTEGSRQVRESFRAAGVRFVLCFFSENYQDTFDCYQYKSEYLAAFSAIADFVAAIPDMGLLLKPKISARSPALLGPTPALECLRQEGRFIECSGSSRHSQVFPYEAAQAADIVLGDAWGCTAAYEASLGGVRAVVSGTSGSASATQKLLDEHGLAYPTLNEALEAIRAVYEKRPGAERIGDWSRIACHFDSHRDYNAGHRLRATILASIGLDVDTAKP